MSGDIPAAERPENLSDGDQTSSDADQTSADLDQTSSDADQTASDRDQVASDRDQRAADLDQADSDRVQGPGADSPNAAHTRRTRSQTALERDITSQVRSETSRIREATAERRDHEAEARDAAAAARDQLAAAFDAEIEQLESPEAQAGDDADVGQDGLLRASRDRQRAAASRARAAAQRAHAARDRAQARRDREHAANDRRAAAEEIAVEGVDHLTGTLRRRVGMVAIERELARTRRAHEPLVVAFVDIDGLKVLNDSQGHGEGDELVRGVARCIQLALRSYDVVMRFGGDEFVCCLAGQDLAGVRGRFEEISAHIASKHDGAGITVGLAEAGLQESVDDLIVRADEAMLVSRERR